MLRSLLLIAALACLAPSIGFAAEQNMEYEEDGQLTFVTPSGNVGCIYTPEGGTDVYEPLDGGPELSCDRIDPDYVNVTLGPLDEAILTEDPGEQSCCGADNVFKYDNELILEGFICYSETTGLVCQTESGEHGFLISKAHVVTY